MDREKRFLAAHAACHDRIYRYFGRRTDNAATAEDLCAEVFRITWEKTGTNESLSVMVLFGIGIGEDLSLAYVTGGRRRHGTKSRFLV